VTQISFHLLNNFTFSFIYLFIYLLTYFFSTSWSNKQLVLPTDTEDEQRMGRDSHAALHAMQMMTLTYQGWSRASWSTEKNC
jgi:hypothetical protein